MSTKVVSAVGDAGYETVDGQLCYGLFSYNPATKTQTFIKYGKYIGIEEIFKGEGMKTLLRIGFTDLDGELKETVIERGMLGEKKELQKYLLSIGADVHAGSIAVLLKCFAATESDTEKISDCHEKTGWKRDGNTLDFCGNALVSAEVDKKSTYVGIYDLGRRGSFKAWLSMVIQHVIGWIPMELVLLIGLSPLISALIDDCRLIFHMMGDSSRGKTTGGILAVSTSGCPNPSETARRKNLKGKGLHSLLTTWNGTDNAITAMLNGLDGTIIVLDELSKLSGSSELTKILYTFSDGVDKNRKHVSGSIDDTDVFHTNVLSIGEESLIERAGSANTGIRMRVCELRAEFTRDAVQSEAIKKCCNENYGHAAPKMAKYMVGMGYKAIISTYDRWCTDYLAALMEAGDTSKSPKRLATFGAVILATAEIASAALGIEFSIQKIKTFLLDQMMDANSERNVGDRAYEALWAFTVENAAHFTKGNAIEWSKNIPCYGRIESSKDGNGTEVSFKRNTLERILKENLHFSNPSVIIDDFYRRDRLNHEKGKKYRKRKITSDDQSKAVITVVFPEEE